MSHYDDIEADKRKVHYNLKKGSIKKQIDKMDDDEVDFLFKVVTNIENYLTLQQLLKDFLSGGL